MIPPSTTLPSDPSLEGRVAAVGAQLRRRLEAVVAAVPEGGLGPQNLARALGLDKVFASRLLKALRAKDPIATAYHVPGPEPLRRFCRAARKKGVGAELVRAAEGAVEEFYAFVRQEIGDRSALDAILSAWLPEAREEFELRRKQAAYRALSQLKGISVRTNLASVFLHPAADGENIDLVWVFGMFGLQRLRPGATLKLASRRMLESPGQRRPRTLDGEGTQGPEGFRLDGFCDAPPAALDVRAAGENVHYLLGGEDFGSRALSDLVLAEVNLAEMPRTVAPETGRKGYVFAEVAAPSRTLLFDVIVHRDVYPGLSPELVLYDASLEGVADVNDPARDVDRLDLSETLQPLGDGPAQLRIPELPHYGDLVRHVFAKLGWDGEAFRSWRTRIDYPLYGTQVVAAFDPPPGA